MITGVTLRFIRLRLLHFVFENQVQVAEKFVRPLVFRVVKSFKHSRCFDSGLPWKGRRNNRRNEHHSRNSASSFLGLPPVAFGALSFFTSKDQKDIEKDTMGDEGVVKALQDADVFYKNNKFQEVYDTLAKLKDQTSHCELQWKLARAARDLSQLSATSNDQKKELIYSGLQFAENAVAANDQNFAAHKWKGILLSDVSEFEGYKKQIANAYVIRDEFLKACELNPQDAVCHFLIGEWCFTVADMGWVQRQAAKALFGTPPSSSYEEALKHFEKAEQVKSGFYVGNYVSLGRTYLRLKKTDEAKKWLTKATEFESENEKDDKCKDEAKEMLKKL